jgi:hypothetical protein
MNDEQQQISKALNKLVNDLLLLKSFVENTLTYEKCTTATSSVPDLQKALNNAAENVQNKINQCMFSNKKEL